MNISLESGCINTSLSGYFESDVRVGTRRQKTVGLAKSVVIARHSFWLPGVSSPKKDYLLNSLIVLRRKTQAHLKDFGVVTLWLERATDGREFADVNPT